MGIGSNVNITRVVCLTISLDNVKTCNLSLQGTGEVGIGTIGNLGAVEVFYGAHELGLFQRTVTYNDSGFEHLSIVGKHEINFVAIADCFFNCLVTEELAYENGITLCFYGIGAVRICHCTGGRTLNHHGRTLNGETL